MKKIKLNELDIYNASTYVFCHPNVEKQILSQIEKIEDPFNIPSCTYRPRKLQLTTNPYCQEYEIELIYPKNWLKKWAAKLLRLKFSLKLGLIKERHHALVYILDDYIVDKDNFRYTQNPESKDFDLLKMNKGIFIAARYHQPIANHHSHVIGNSV